MNFNATALAFPFVCENAEETSNRFRQARHVLPINGYPTTVTGPLDLVFVAFMPNGGDGTVSAGPKENGRSRQTSSFSDQHLGGHVQPSEAIRKVFP